MKPRYEWSGPHGGFSSPLGSQEGMLWSAWVQKEGRKCYCTPLQRNSLFLQHSRPGLISTVLPTYLFIFALVGGGTALPTAMRRGTAISSSSWPFGAWERFLDWWCAACSDPRWRDGSQRLCCGKGNVCCWRKHSLHWLPALLGVGRFCPVL